MSNSTQIYKQFVVDYAPWDEGDYVIAIRPASVAIWQDVPIGPVLSESKARIIAEWLKVALPELQKVIIQVEANEQV